MRKRNGVRRLLLALVNVVIIVAAALIVTSRAEEDDSPTYSSVNWPADTEPALRPLSEGGTLPSSSSSSPDAPAPAASGTDTSAPLVAPTAVGSAPSFATSDASFTQAWYEHVHPSLTSMASDSSSWSQPGAALSGYGSASGASSYGRSSPAGGYGGGGGGFPSSGGGLPASPQGSVTSASNSRAGLLSQTNDQPIAGTSLLPQAPGNSSFGAAFQVVQFPGHGPAGSAGRGATGFTAGASQTQQQPVSVPEPSTLLLLAGGLALASCRSRRKLTRRS